MTEELLVSGLAAIQIGGALAAAVLFDAARAYGAFDCERSRVGEAVGVICNGSLPPVHRSVKGIDLGGAIRIFVVLIAPPILIGRGEADSATTPVSELVTEKGGQSGGIPGRHVVVADGHQRAHDSAIGVRMVRPVHDRHKLVVLVVPTQ